MGFRWVLKKELKVRCKLPIPTVGREIRSRTGSVSEEGHGMTDHLEYLAFSWPDIFWWLR